MRETTESLMRRWVGVDPYRCVRVHYYPESPARLCFAAIGWNRGFNACIVSMQSGPDIDTAVRRLLRAGLKKDKAKA